MKRKKLKIQAHLVSMKFKSQLWEIISKYPPRLLNRSSRTAVSKDQRVNQVRLANYANELSGKWLEILKKSSRQKLVCKKSNFCKIQGMSKGSKLHAAWYVERFYKISYVEGVERNKNSHNTVNLRHLSLMSKESKVHLIYNVDSNSKYSN